MQRTYREMCSLEESLGKGHMEEGGDKSCEG